MRTQIACFLIATALVLFSCPPGFSEELVLATGEWKPYTSEHMENNGFFTEIVSAVAAEMGVRPRYRFLPWKRCEFAVRKGKAWAAFPYSHNEERARDFAFSGEVAVSTTRFFYFNAAMQDVTWDDLDDLRPFRIGGVIGYFYEKGFQEAGLDVEYTSGELLNLKKLVAGRIDLFPVNEWVGWDLIREHFPDRVQDFGVLERPHSVQGLHLMVRKDDPASQDLLERFDRALNRLKASGAFDAILESTRAPR